METSQAPVVNTRGLHSQALDLLRFPLAIIIVAVHAFPNLTDGVTFAGETIRLGNHSIFEGVLNFIYAFMRHQSVPIYFFISGYVFFLGAEFSKETYVRKLKNRVKTLLIPYLIWNTLFVASQIVINLPALVKNPAVWNWGSLPSAFWTYDGGLFSTTGATGSDIYPINVPLWFLRNLMIVVLCTPAIYHLIRKFRHYPVILLGVAWLVFTLIKPADNELPAGFLSAFFFFSWGAYMSICKKDMVAEFGRFFKPSMILYPTLGMLCMLSAYVCPEARHVIKQINIFVGLLFAYNLAVWLLQKGYCRAGGLLPASSFFIYVSHMAIIGVITAAYFTLFGMPLNAERWPRMFLTFALTVTISLTAFWLLKRYTPSLLRVLTGRK